MESKYDHHEFFHHKRQTNADRIRQMSDEELVEFFDMHMDCSDCPADCKHNRCCEFALLAWLQQEVDDGGSD